MATIKPFAALRPRTELAAQICELPYDVMSSDEAREMAAGNPLNFLHVSKPEIDLSPDIDVHAPEVYAKGKENFSSLIAQGALKQDDQPGFYLYRQVMGKHSQVGIVAAASCEEYLEGTIKKHELTRPDKEDDRVRHIETLNSQTGPVFLTYRASEKINAFVAKKVSKKPDIDYVARDGVKHSAWTLFDPADIKFIESEFAKIPALYIADGHHRSAAAARVFQSRNGAGQSGRFLSVIFPHDQMQILPYNRVVADLNGWTPEQILDILKTVFVFQGQGQSIPQYKHELCFYMSGKWRTLIFLPKILKQHDNILENLDVELLQAHILSEVFGIYEPRTSKKIQFVGGIRGPAELEKLVNSGEYACAFSMFPTRIDDLMGIADAGGIMPPKSTWFEPKLRDGMFCHMI